jgi:hypothetical protein
VIDGYSQPSATANTLVVGDNAVILIRIDGASAGAGTTGLTLSTGSAGSSVQGLSITRFAAQGISVRSSNNSIGGNFIGIAPDGTPAGNTGLGIQIDAVPVPTASNNTIGGNLPATRNIVSGNGGGIRIVDFPGSATGNTIAGNYFGTNTFGTAIVPQSGAGLPCMATPQQ